MNRVCSYLTKHIPFTGTNLRSASALHRGLSTHTFNPLTALPKDLKHTLEQPYEEQMFKLNALPFPWSKRNEFKKINDEIQRLSTLERDILCRLWLSHRSFGSDNHIAHAAVCAGTNMIACALAGLPLTDFHRVDEILDLKTNFLNRPYTGRGEGNTLPDRLPGKKNELYGSTWEQYAQAHFGISINASGSTIITIKGAQGAKPTEGGKLPEVKNTPQVADARGVIPGIPLDSPPPHHNIYSIEDLHDVIQQLKSLNPDNKITVKIVAQDGIVETAKGCAKAGADIIELSFPGGGTGSTTEYSRRDYGRSFTRRNDDNMINQVHQALIDDGYRHKVHLYVDGLMATPKDVITSMASGADIVGIGTAIMIVGQGCIKADICHTGDCPVGIQTMDPDLVKNFKGSPSRVATFLIALAKGASKLANDRGIHVTEDLIGNGSLLEFQRDVQLVGSRVAQDRPVIHPIEKQIIQDLSSNKSNFTVQGKDLTNTDHNSFVRLAAVVHQNMKKKPITVTVKGLSFPGSGFAAFTGSNLSIIAPESMTDARCAENAMGTVVVESAGDAAMMGVNAGSKTYLKDAGQRYAVLAKGGTHIVRDIGTFGLNYVFGGSWIILGKIGPGFGAAFRNGDIYIKKDTDRSLFHDDIKHLNPLPITEGHQQLIGDHLHNYFKYFPDETPLSMSEFTAHYNRYNPIAQQLSI